MGNNAKKPVVVSNISLADFEGQDDPTLALLQCQTTLTRLINKWKELSDQDKAIRQQIQDKAAVRTSTKAEIDSNTMHSQVILDQAAKLMEQVQALQSQAGAIGKTNETLGQTLKQTETEIKGLEVELLQIEADSAQINRLGMATRDRRDSLAVAVNAAHPVPVEIPEEPKVEPAEAVVEHPADAKPEQEVPVQVIQVPAQEVQLEAPQVIVGEDHHEPSMEEYFAMPTLETTNVPADETPVDEGSQIVLDDPIQPAQLTEEDPAQLNFEDEEQPEAQKAKTPGFFDGLQASSIVGRFIPKGK